MAFRSWRSCPIRSARVTFSVAIRARPATERAYALAKQVNPNFGQPVNRTEEERRVLFGQTAAVVR